VTIPFADGHTRQLPVITQGPFEYSTYAVDFYRAARAAAGPDAKIKQAVISASAMSLLYPAEPIADYSREQFIEDVVRCAVRDIRQCLDEGADTVQVDFTEGRLSLKLDPSGGLLQQFLDLNERVFSAFSAEERLRLGIHVCPGADADSTHSADVSYAALLGPLLRTLSCGRFYLQMKSEANPDEALAAVRDNLKSNQTIFVGVTDVNTTTIETPEEVCSCIRHAANFIPTSQLGVCDDCGFSPFADDVSTGRDIAFAKMRARVSGTGLANKILNKDA
jgi:5-methyltetrahydropteroyltriglutamate--homocysteine methyltransferase